MDNKKLGIILLFSCILLGSLVFAFHSALQEQTDASCGCETMEETGFCPHEKQTPIQTYLGIIIISALAALGLYLIFFDRSQKEIVSALSKQKQVKIEEEKFDILLKGLSKEEQKIMIAVKEQDGITQQTLRLRTDLHKSKLSILLDNLEKKELIKKVKKAKTNQIFMKIRL